jgi:hypothetical protein
MRKNIYVLALYFSYLPDCMRMVCPSSKSHIRAQALGLTGISTAKYSTLVMSYQVAVMRKRSVDEFLSTWCTKKPLKTKR